MSDIFGGVEPPAWLTNMTKQEPGLVGKIVGQLVGGLGESAEIAMTRAQDKQKQGVDTSWLKELPGSIQPGMFSARMDLQNPLWKQQLQMAQLNMAHQQMQIDSQQSLIDARAQKMRMDSHDQTTFSAWLQAHPTWESRQGVIPPELWTSEGRQMWNDLMMRDQGSLKQKSTLEGIKSWDKSVTELQKTHPELGNPFVPYMGQLPTADIQKKFGEASARAQATMVVPQVITLPNGMKVYGTYDKRTGKFDTPKNTLEEIAAREAARLTDEKNKTRLGVLADKVKQSYRAIQNNFDDSKLPGLQKQYADANTELQNLLQQLTPTTDQGANQTIGPLSGPSTGVSRGPFLNFRDQQQSAAPVAPPAPASGGGDALEGLSFDDFMKRRQTTQ